MTNNKTRFLICLAVLITATCSAVAQSQLMIPFNTSFNHSDNHWIAWMPTHPLYESIEVRSNPGPTAVTVQVFFTERAGGKNQIHYFNSDAAAKAFRGPAAYYREMVYTVTGAKGSPQAVDLRFSDKDNRPVELSMKFAPGQPLSDLHAGLTNQMGHNRDHLFLIFFREKAASAAESRLFIDGQDFSINAQRATSEEQLTRTGYRSNAFIVTFPFGKSQYLWKDGVLTNSWRRSFRSSAQSDGGATYRSEVADGSKVEIITTSSGDMREYKHLRGKHVVRMLFQPALPSLASAREGQRIRYEVSINDFGVLVQGVAAIRESGNRIVIDWQHELPEWSKGYHFTSVVQRTNDGYDLEVVRTRANPVK